MFLTVTPNLCIERTIEIPEFSLGEVHRVAPQKLHFNAGGKGINAARVAAQLGSGVLALAWVGKNQRAWFESQLAREGVAHELIEVKTDTRVCTNILHGQNQKTEIVEAGFPLAAQDGARMLARFDALLPACELAAIGGSYPDGASTQHHLVAMSALAKKHNKKLLVDGKGAAFEEVLKSNFLPWAIKPNCEEAAAFLKYPVENETSEHRATCDFLNLGIEVVLLSCGARGAWLGTRASTHFLTSPRVQEVSPVGSGDALVAAFAAQFLRDGDLLEAARWSVAAGAANASQKLSAFCTRVEIERLVPQVQITQM